MNLPTADKIETHENAIEVLLILAEQQLSRESMSLKMGPGSGFRKEMEDNIETLKKAIEYGHDYLVADSYPQFGVKAITDRYKRNELVRISRNIRV